MAATSHGKDHPDIVPLDLLAEELGEAERMLDRATAVVEHLETAIDQSRALIDMFELLALGPANPLALALAQFDASGTDESTRPA